MGCSAHFWRNRGATHRTIRDNMSLPASVSSLKGGLREICEASFHALKPGELMKFKEDSSGFEMRTETADFIERVHVNQQKLTAEVKPQYEFIVCGSGSSGS